MEEQSQQADAADLARFGCKQVLRLAKTISYQLLGEYTHIEHGMASHD